MKMITFAMVLALALNAQAPNSIGPIFGKWHLLMANEDEVNVPQHRVDFVFRDVQGQLRGAVINRATGADIPLGSITFDGKTLALTLEGANGATLIMTPNGSKLEGQYWVSGKQAGVPLKLVRFLE
jgi:hypothetical protein